MFTNNEEIEATVGAQFHCANASGGLATAPSRSLAALLLGSAALLFAAPQAAFAQNECDPLDPPSADGGTADSYTCDQDSYPSVTYTADGDLTLDVVGGGASEVTLTDGDSATDGFSLTAAGADSLTFNSVLTIQDNHSDVVLDFATETGGIALDLDTIDPGNSATHAVRAVSTGTGAGDGGDIAITSGFITSGAGTGIEAVTAGGDIAITTGSIRADEHTIRADTRGGDGTMVLNVVGGRLTSAGTANIFATSGSGLMEINIQPEAQFNRETPGQSLPLADAAIRTEAGGDAVINLLGSETGTAARLPIQAGVGGYAVDMTAAAGTATTLNISRPVIPGIEPSGGSSRLTATLGVAQVPVLRGAGAGQIVVNIDNGIRGRIIGGADFSANTGGVTVNNGIDPAAGNSATAGWIFAEDAVTFGNGDDVVNNRALIVPNSAGKRTPLIFQLLVENVPVLREATVAFGGGHDEFHNAGTMLLGEGTFQVTSLSGSGIDIGQPQTNELSASVASTTTFQDLEVFDNSGLIVLGGWMDDPAAGGVGVDENFYMGDLDAASEALCRETFVGDGLTNPPPDGFPCSATGLRDTDRLTNDVLALPNVAFNGSGESRIVMDAVFGTGVPQPRCHAGDNERSGEEDNFKLLGADCVDLRGGTTSGNTQLVMRDAAPLQRSAYNPEGLVVVDVGGGSSSAGDFTLSPDSDHYATTAGGTGIIDKGLLVYPLIYDTATQQHKLVGLPGSRAFQMSLLGHTVQEGARRSADAVRGRMRTLRAGNASVGGFWGDVAHASAERDTRHAVSALGERFTFNNDFDQDVTTLTLGRDASFGDGAWAAGGSLGYVRSRAAFDGVATRSAFDGATLGVYGGYRAGAFHVDASLHHGWMQVDYDDPVFAQQLAVNEILEGASEGNRDVQDTEARSLDARVEAGWRLDLGDALSLEPLAGLSWVRADIDDLDLPSVDPNQSGNTVVFDTPTSFRGGVGARLGLDSAMGSVNVRYNLTARFWNEFDGESDVTIESAGPDVAVSDEFDGTFTEIRAGVALSNASGSLSGFLSADGTFHEDYDSLGGELGFRYQW